MIITNLCSWVSFTSAEQKRKTQQATGGKKKKTQKPVSDDDSYNIYPVIIQTLALTTITKHRGNKESRNRARREVK
jgi:hypothetical protein